MTDTRPTVQAKRELVKARDSSLTAPKSGYELPRVFISRRQRVALIAIVVASLLITAAIVAQNQPTKPAVKSFKTAAVHDDTSATTNPQPISSSAPMAPTSSQDSSNDSSSQGSSSNTNSSSTTVTIDGQTNTVNGNGNYNQTYTSANGNTSVNVSQSSSTSSQGGDN